MRHAPVRERSDSHQWQADHWSTRPLYILAAVVATRSLRLVTVTPRIGILDIMLAKVLTAAGLVSAGLLLIVVTMTTPASGGATVILAVFLLSYVVILTTLTFLIWLLARLIDRAGREVHLLKKPYEMSLKKSYYYSTVLAMGPVIIVSLQSVGGVGIYELALIALFMVLGCIYVSRRTA